MKKNILTVIILVLVFVNMVLTAIMMFTVLPSAKKTDKMITDICSILDLELASDEEGKASEKVPVKNLVFYDVEEEMTISLKMGKDGEQHFLIGKVSIAMNSKDKDYKSLGGADMSTKESMITNAVSNVVSTYDFEQAQGKTAEMEEKILAALQETFGSKFITQVLFSDVKIQ